MKESTFNKEYHSTYEPVQAENIWRIVMFDASGPQTHVEPQTGMGQLTLRTVLQIALNFVQLYTNQ